MENNNKLGDYKVNEKHFSLMSYEAHLAGYVLLILAIVIATTVILFYVSRVIEQNNQMLTLLSNMWTDLKEK